MRMFKILILTTTLSLFLPLKSFAGLGDLDLGNFEDITKGLKDAVDQLDKNFKNQDQNKQPVNNSDKPVAKPETAEEKQKRLEAQKKAEQEKKKKLDAQRKAEQEKQKELQAQRAAEEAERQRIEAEQRAVEEAERLRIEAEQKALNNALIVSKRYFSTRARVR